MSKRNTKTSSPGLEEWYKYWLVYREAASRAEGGKVVKGYPAGLMALAAFVREEEKQQYKKGRINAFKQMLRGMIRMRGMPVQGMRKYLEKYLENRIARENKKP